MTRRFIPVAAPMLVGNEKAYVMDCLESTWISSRGLYVQKFESAFADYCGVEHAVSCCNGTAALHLALKALGVGHGDEVIAPTLTYVATANAVTYCGAEPVFVDSDPEIWNADPTLIEERITPRTKGIIVVHLYGYPADMDPILRVARQHGLFVVEDCAQAHGAEYGGRKVGSLGDMAIFSFFGSKTFSTGEGGMVIAGSEALAEKVRRLRDRGEEPLRRYWYNVVGYNYRMTNIAAAIGLAQVEKASWHVERRREVASWYKENLGGSSPVSWQSERDGTRSCCWMFTIKLGDGVPVERDAVALALKERGVETRPAFHPMHTLPPYAQASLQGAFPVAERIGRWGISLPTWAGLTRDDVDYVCATLLAASGESNHP